MLCFDSCLHRVNFYGKRSVGLGGVVSLISLFGCSRVALSSICVGSLVVPGFYLLVAPLLMGSFLQRVYWYSQLPPYLVCDLGKYKVEWIMTFREYSMGFKVPTSRKEIRDPLEKYSNNHENLSN